PASTRPRYRPANDARHHPTSLFRFDVAEPRTVPDFLSLSVRICLVSPVAAFARMRLRPLPVLPSLSGTDVKRLGETDLKPFLVADVHDLDHFRPANVDLGCHARVGDLFLVVVLGTVGQGFFQFLAEFGFE